MNKQENMSQSKEQNKSPEIKPKEMEIYELPDKQLKIIVLKKLNDHINNHPECKWTESANKKAQSRRMDQK